MARKHSKRDFLVTWVTDIEDSESPREAAQRAFEMMQREGTWANVFTVKNKKTGEETTVDLLEDQEED